MTDNRTTELLRKLLEERGLSCQTHYLHAFWCVGPKLYESIDNLDGTLTVGRLTPEQAIAATLGSETCELEPLPAIDVTLNMLDNVEWGVCSECGYAVPMDAKFCNECGRKVRGVVGE